MATTADAPPEPVTRPPETAPTSQSRRSFLRAGALAAGGAVLAIETLAGERKLPLPPGHTRLVLGLTDISAQTVGRPRGAVPQHGDQVVTTAALVLDGDEVGEAHLTDVHLVLPGLNRQGLSASTGQHVLHLEHGTLVGMGAATHDDQPDEYAVVGGTGRYARASGTYLLDRTPGAASIQLDLTIPETDHGA